MARYYAAAAPGGVTRRGRSCSADALARGGLAPRDDARPRGHGQEVEAVAPDDDLVAVAQHASVDARAVDEHAVEAAVVEQAHTVGVAHDQGVTARDGRVVEAQVGR